MLQLRLSPAGAYLAADALLRGASLAILLSALGGWASAAAAAGAWGGFVLLTYGVRVCRSRRAHVPTLVGEGEAELAEQVTASDRLPPASPGRGLDVC